MENLRNGIDAKPVRNKKDYLKLTSKCPNKILILPLPLNNNFPDITQQKLHF